ncbi:hypothetical protein [Enterococcus sp. RIT-PI-f]|uniref:hypothetical protein n=1 Tax=Enterococcus sp. RIT-PI-f TaxID=1690244 RepID=UPI0035679526
MVEVEILDAQIKGFTLPLYPLEWEAFLEVTEAMNPSEMLSFQLLEVDGAPFYQGKFEKQSSLESFEDDLKKKLKLLVKKKGITKEEEQQILEMTGFIDKKPSLPTKHKQKDEATSTRIPRPSKKEKVSQSQRSNIFFRTYSISTLVKLFLILLIVAGAYFLKEEFLSGEEQPTTSISSSVEITKITLDNYMEVAEKETDRQEEVVNFLVEQEAFEQLEAFQEAYPTEIGKFEVAFNQKDWQTVIEADISTLNNARKMMMAIAFIQLGQLEEAKLISESLEDTRLFMQLAVGYLRQKNVEEAKKIQDKLNNDQLAEMIDTTEIYVQMIAHYSKEKDTKNQELWERKLEQIGKEYLPQ